MCVCGCVGVYHNYVFVPPFPPPPPPIGSHETECALIVFPSVGMKQLEMKGDFDEVVGTTVRYLVEQLP